MCKVSKVAGDYVTPEQIEAARSVNLLDYLQRSEPGNVIPSAPGEHKLKDHDSLKISNGKFHWFSRGIGVAGNWLLEFMPWLVGAIGLMITFFGVAALGIGFSSDSPAEKQKGIIGFVGGIIVMGAGALIRAVGNALTGGAGGGGATGPPIEMQFGGPEVMANIETGLESLGIGALLSMFLTLFLIRIILLIVGALVTVIIIHRFIEIYMYVSLAALPMSTFVSSEMSSIGKNYVKTIAAYSFQGLLIIVVLNIFGTLVTSQITANIAAATGDGSDVGGLGGSMFLLAGFSCLLAFAIIKTGAVAKAIFGVS